MHVTMGMEMHTKKIIGKEGKYAREESLIVEKMSLKHVMQSK